MTTASQNPLLERVATALKGRLFVQTSYGDGIRISPNSVEEAAQAALEACQAEAMAHALKAAHAHVQELRDAWERGAISEHDGQGGTRSNRNVEVEVQLRALLAKLEAQP